MAKSGDPNQTAPSGAVKEQSNLGLHSLLQYIKVLQYLDLDHAMYVSMLFQ